jgi:hypothetical protein
VKVFSGRECEKVFSGRECVKVFSGRECVKVFLVFVYICIVKNPIIKNKGSFGSHLKQFKLHHIFVSAMSQFFCVQTFVDIGGIVDHHCLLVELLTITV